jgi:23S rRNA pseudouridine2605 synthase
MTILDHRDHDAVSFSPKRHPSSPKARSFSSLKDRVTLDRAFSKAGAFSRTDAIRKIRSGRVKVNGKIVRDPDQWVSLLKDTIHCNGQVLRERKKQYLLFYKPRGVVTSHGDAGRRQTVYDFLKGLREWVFPVGRLDMDTSGMLLLTNDTEFADRLTNPVFKIPKTYQLKVNLHPTTEQLLQLERGLVLKNGEKTLPAKVRLLRQGDRHSFLELTIVEGKNRQVRRMIEALGGRVLKLVRTRIGSLALGDLQIGRYRTLSREEIASLWYVPPKPSGPGARN